MKLHRIYLVGVGAFSALLVSSAVAFAQVPPAYQGEGGEAQENVAGGGADTLGSLPFTGLDLALIVGAGLLLVLVGFSLRRFAARRTTT